MTKPPDVYPVMLTFAQSSHLVAWIGNDNAQPDRFDTTAGFLSEYSGVDEMESRLAESGLELTSRDVLAFDFDHALVCSKRGTRHPEGAPNLFLDAWNVLIDVTASVPAEASDLKQLLDDNLALHDALTIAVLPAAIVEPYVGQASLAEEDWLALQAILEEGIRALNVLLCRAPPADDLRK